MPTNNKLLLAKSLAKKVNRLPSEEVAYNKAVYGFAPQAYAGNSGMDSSYFQWLSGVKSSGYALPRPVEDFITSILGPQNPIQPYPLDRPALGAAPDSLRAEPRRWEYRPGYNLPKLPGSEKMIPFATLKEIADKYSVVRACINLRINEVIDLDYDIVPTKMASEVIKHDRAARRDFEERVVQARKFWRRPDERYNNFLSWLRALLEEIFVYDAPSLYLHPSRLRGGGPFHSDLGALEIITGSTILPLVDMQGSIPRPPAVAYQQFLFGVPRTDLMTVPYLTQDGGDDFSLAEAGPPVAEFRGDQLLYIPYYTRVNSMYGFSPVEQSFLPIQTGLKRQQWRLEFFDSATLPGLFIVAPPDWTSKQIRQLQDALNSLGQGQDMRWRHIVLPGNTTYREVRPNDLSNSTDSTIYGEVLMSFDVKPMEIGLLPGGVSQGLGSSGLLEGQMAASTRHSLHPLVRWLEDSIFDYIMQYVWHQPDLHFKFLGFDEPDDELKHAQTIYAYIRSGLMSVDEGRTEIDRIPWGLPDTKRPILQQLMGNGMMEPPPGTAGSPDDGEMDEKNRSLTAPSSEQGNPAQSQSQLRPGSGIGGTKGTTPATPHMESTGGRQPISSVRTTTGAATKSVDTDSVTASTPGMDVEPQYGCLLIPLPPSCAEHIAKLQNLIELQDYATEGPETNPHITVLYGLAGHVTTSDIETQIEQFKIAPFDIIFGGASAFESDDFDVLKLEVDSLGVHGTHSILEHALPYTRTYPQFIPHVTIGYLKPELAQKYLGDYRFMAEANRLMTFTTYSLAYSLADQSQMFKIPLFSPPTTDLAKNTRDEIKKLRSYIRHGNDPARFESALLTKTQIFDIVREAQK